MEIQKITFKSESACLPSLTIPFGISKFDSNDELLDFCLREEPNILREVSPPPTRIGDENWMTSRLYSYNLFDYEDDVIQKLKDHIRQGYQSYITHFGRQDHKVYVHGWINVLQSDGRFITPHDHRNAHCGAPENTSFISGNMSLRAKDTNTYYMNVFTSARVSIKNIPGEMVFFPSFLTHWTDKNPSSEESRVSIAFDLITEPVYEQYGRDLFTLLV
jgi:hypothetical protein